MLQSIPDDTLKTITSFGTGPDVGRLGRASKACFASTVAGVRERLANRTARGSGATTPRIACIVVPPGVLAVKGWGKLRFLVELERRVQATEAKYVREPPYTTYGAQKFRRDLEMAEEGMANAHCLGCGAEMCLHQGPSLPGACATQPFAPSRPQTGP